MKQTENDKTKGGNERKITKEGEHGERLKGEEKRRKKKEGKMEKEKEKEKGSRAAYVDYLGLNEGDAS